MEFKDVNYEDLLDEVIKVYSSLTQQQNISDTAQKYLGRELSFENVPGVVSDAIIFTNLHAHLSTKYNYGKAVDKTCQYYIANPSWKEASELGGHYAYQNHLEQEKNADRLHKEAERKARWFESENAEQMFKDYPQTKKQAFWAILIAALALLATIVQLIVEASK